MLAAIAVHLAIDGWAGNHAVAQNSSEAKQVPHMIECEVKGVRFFLYLERITPDGEILYLTPDKRGAARVKDGVLERVGGGVETTCTGKTLEEMVADGKAYFMQNARK